ncbi:T-cell differentiation antigen CD6 [Fukomys damarensis]|uniref:T-cell differentiation antigen CD6 n=1 Tax=Fukomys damarensis TaxID=885580 RepID=UPI0014553BA7|nr:T-cell differentiation antigen CD6 [Fukomys damarensis]
MAPAMWLFLGLAGRLSASLSGLQLLATPAPSQHNTSHQAPETGTRLRVRLAHWNGSCQGEVQVQLHTAWVPVCLALWDQQAAEAVCQALGCGRATATPKPELWTSTGNTSITNATRGPALAVWCRGPEWKLCEVVEDVCGTDVSPARVTCAGMGLARPVGSGRAVLAAPGSTPQSPVLSQEHQAWRLTGGGDRCAGQAEVQFRGVWSTVCDSEWYQSEADVLCRALGCGISVDRPPGQPHSLPGRMFYSCAGEEARPSLCTWRFNNSNLCSQSRAARVLCSASQAPHNLSSSRVPSSVQPGTAESLVTVQTAGKESRELALLIPSIVLGVLLLGALVSIALLLLRVKGKYALSAAENHQHLLPTAAPAGSNSYHAVPGTVPKEEVPQLLAQGPGGPPKDPDSSSGSDYEHYDFSTQPPMALTTFYNSQRYRISEEEAQQSRFRMPPLEEGLEELQAPPMLAALLGPCTTDTAPRDHQCHHGDDSGSSTSSGEDYCNSPGTKAQPWSPQAFPLEQIQGLELAGPQMPFPGGGPPEDNSSSTSSGEWYQNFRSPLQGPSTEQFECPGPSGPQRGSSSADDYDDIGAA